MNNFFYTILIVVVFPSLWGGEKLSYQRDIMPILSEKCFACHGPDGGEFGESWRGGLRLDKVESAMANILLVKREVENRKLAAKNKPINNEPISKERFAIVPGDLKKSTLIARIFSDDEDEVMPPPDAKHKMTEKEKKLLERWILEGATYDKHWAYINPIKSAPEVKDKKWSVNVIDQHILAKLEENNTIPSVMAEKHQWLRRVSLDLTGLPPSLELQEKFFKDNTPEAKGKVVDELLKTDDYAERMALMWLDNARYADSSGFQFDWKRTMSPWRDWVINAFKNNLSYDQFVIKQIAGDLLPNKTQDDLIATGFNRNNLFTFEGGVFSEEYRTIYVNDRVTTFGTLFLGLTLECTRCHDHKYDELTMKDYYSLFAFFNTTTEEGIARDKALSNKPIIKVNELEVMVMEEQSKPRKSFILNKGLWDSPGSEVQPNTPNVLPPMNEKLPKNRLGLAQWLVSSDNPLMARVTVNRFWQHFMGQGLVETADNFGVMGRAPTHPKLLDWLAVDFREQGWDLHKLIKNIVLSSAYGQSSKARRDLDDPQNKLYARASSLRLDAEIIRDQALVVSGLLVQKVGGISVMPYQPEGYWNDLAAPPSHKYKYEQIDGENLYRKSIYSFWRRAAVNPSFALFDAPNREVCTVTRQRTNTPLQALNLLHDPTYIEAAKFFAVKVYVKDDFDSSLSKAFQMLLVRKPSSKELGFMKTYFNEQLALYQKNPSRLVSYNEVGKKIEHFNAELAALADCCLVIFNLSETISRD